MRLVLCTDCQRHVRDDAPTCPFCGRANTATSTAPERVARLGRAAIMAFGVAATAISVDACKKDTDNIAQPYGAPPNPLPDAAPVPTETATTTPSVDAAAPPQNVVDASPAADPSVPKDAGAKDAAPKKDAGPVATVTPTVPTTDLRNLKKPYGAPPIPDDDYV